MRYLQQFQVAQCELALLRRIQGPSLQGVWGDTVRRNEDINPDQLRASERDTTRTVVRSEGHSWNL